MRTWLLLLVSCAGCALTGEPLSGGEEPVTVDGALRSDGAADDEQELPGPIASVDADELVQDPCAAKALVCPNARAAEGSGLVAIDRCAFPMAASAAFTTAPPLIAALEKLTTPVTVADVLADLNRVGTHTTRVPGSPAGVAFGIRWQSDDDTSEHWIPQGISGSADADDSGLVDGKRVVLSSWYNAPPTGTASKGIRVAFVDVASATYRFVLLVVPKGTAQAPDFEPLVVHAGGIVWYRNLLYVVDTNRGLRVFDLRHILRVPADIDEMGCAHGTCRAGQYKYVLPQSGSYVTRSPCGMRFSFASLDRSASPPALVTGEYCTEGTCPTPLSGRVYRWRLDPTTGLLAAAKSWPKDAFLMGQRQVQGAATNKGVYYLSSSAPGGDGGALYRVTVGRSATSRWSDSPESVMIDLEHQQLLCQSEQSPRVLFAARLASYPHP